MTDFYAKNFTKTRALPTQFVDGGEYGGRCRVYRDEIDTTTSMLAADKIYVGKLMPGERFLEGSIRYAAHGSSRTLILGDSGDDDRYLASTAVASAGVTQIAKADGFHYRNDGAEPIDLFLTIGGGALAAATGGIKIHYWVTRD